VKCPQANGIGERPHRTLLGEHFPVEGRRAWFETFDRMQVSLNDHLKTCNEWRARQGRSLKDRLPAGLRRRDQPAEIDEGGANRETAARSPTGRRAPAPTGAGPSGQ